MHLFVLMLVYISESLNYRRLKKINKIMLNGFGFHKEPGLDRPDSYSNKNQVLYWKHHIFYQMALQIAFIVKSSNHNYKKFYEKS